MTTSLKPANKPLVWLPFAAGGLLAALLLPAVILSVLLIATGVVEGNKLSYQAMKNLLDPIANQLIFFIFFTLLIWHAAHRTRMTLQDLIFRSSGIRRLNAKALYISAALATLALAAALFYAPDYS